MIHTAETRTCITLLVLGPLLFLIFINDIADETIGLCKLFADGTSIGDKSYEINSLCNMVNTDLKKYFRTVQTMVSKT